MSEPDEVERVKHLCPKCRSEWISPAHTRCEACGMVRSQYSQGLQQGDIDGHLRGQREATERAAKDLKWAHDKIKELRAAIRRGEDGK